MAVALRREIFGATRGRFDGWTGRHRGCYYCELAWDCWLAFGDV